MGRRIKKWKDLARPSALSKILANLRSRPRLELPKVQSLKLTLASKNDHFGARHFMKDHLPRIRYANPTLDIEVTKAPKTENDAWRPEIELTFADGHSKVLDIQQKWSTSILKEVMEVAGGDPWKKWKEEAAEAGRPLVPGEENEGLIKPTHPRIPLPSLKTYLASKPPPKPKKEKGVDQAKEGTDPDVILKGVQASKEGKDDPKVEGKEIPRGPRPTSGPGAVLPWDE